MFLIQFPNFWDIKKGYLLTIVVIVAVIHIAANTIESSAMI
nr:MAG TPA: hypothetical protein [Caudoviricetes sp.]